GDHEDADDRRLGREPPGEGRHASTPDRDEDDRRGVAEGMVEEPEQDRDGKLDPDRYRPPFPLRKRLPARPHLIPKTDLLGDRRGHYPPSGVRSPSSPSGLNTRMRIRIVNTIDSVQSEPGAFQSRPSLYAWMSPIRSAPSTAPGRLPIPPSTADVNAIRPSVKPWS